MACKFNARAMAVISFLLVFMQQGAIQIATQYNLNENASDVITGIILFFVIGCEFSLTINWNFVKSTAHKEKRLMTVLITFIQKAIMQGNVCSLAQMEKS